MKKSLALDGLGALSQETRLDVFRLLIKAGPDGLAAGAIADKLGARQNTLSSHLNVLVHADLIHRVRQGRNIRYHANYDRMRELLQFLLQDCCNGNASICAPLLNTIAC